MTDPMPWWLIVLAVSAWGTVVVAIPALGLYVLLDALSPTWWVRVKERRKRRIAQAKESVR